MHLPITLPTIIAQNRNMRIVLTSFKNGHVVLAFETRAVNAMQEIVWLSQESQSTAQVTEMLIQELINTKQQNALQEKCIMWFYRAALISALKQVVAHKLENNVSKDKEWAAFS